MEELIQKYNREPDPHIRGKLLEELLKCDDSAENRLRREIYQKRYTKTSGRNPRMADGYIGLWMAMKYRADNNFGFLSRRSAAREIAKTLDQLGIPQFMQQGETARKLLYQEYYHMAALYINACLGDSSFGATLAGVMKLSDDKIRDKITEDVFKVGYYLPCRIGMEQDFALLAEAITQAHDELLPDKGEYLRELQTTI